MAEYSISIDAAGSAKDNEQARNINTLFPYTGGTYKTISLITRRGGIWCSCGGTSQSVTLSVYDQMLDGATVIKTSDTVTCKCYGTGPSETNYAQTTFSDWTQAQSNAAVAAWAAGTLIIKRFVTILSYTSSKHGSPTFRDGQYSDVIAVQGATVPFTQYGPAITLFDVFRSDDGEEENPESTSVYAKIKLAMNDTTGLSDSPALRVYYAQDADPTAESSYLDIGSAFGLTAANLGVEKTVQLSGTWSNGADWYFLIYFSAGEEVADGRLDLAPRATVPLYIAENNNGVSIGQYSTATADEPKFESRWPAYLYGGIAQIGDGSEDALAMLGIQRGSVDAQSVSESKTVAVEVTFERAYAQAPLVIANIVSTSDSYYLGRCNVAIQSVSTAGFTALIANGGSNAVSFGFAWAAFGKIT